MPRTKQQTKKIDIRSAKVVKPRVVIPITNKSRWTALRLLALIRQLEAVAEIDPTKINIKDYMILLDKYTDLNIQYGKEKREKRNARDRKAEAVRSGVDRSDVAGGNAPAVQSPFAG